MEKSDRPLNYTTSEWQLGCANFMNPPVSLVPTGSSIMNPSTMDSSVSFEDSLCPSIWDRRGGEFLNATGATTLPQSLSPFPADSTFIERSARFSCFNSAGNFGNMMMYPLGVSEPVAPCSNGGSIQASQVLSSANASKATSLLQSLRKESHLVEADDGASPVADHWPTEGSPVGRGQGGDLGSMDEVTLGIEASNNDEAPFSAGREAEAKISDDPLGDASAKRLAANKRKRGSGLLESDQGVQLSSIKTAKENTEATTKGEQNLNSTASKFNARQGKENSQNSDAPKEDYIHVRARRGQATNSHSLAERVTGKAVMLDEIINYVQSLQRQVEWTLVPELTIVLIADFHVSVHLYLDALLTYETGNAWDEGLQNVVQMSFGMNAPLNVQELNGSLPPSAHMKVEP
ncbi:hypothetical protein ACLOJK_035240 [Asimina triloba]